MQITGKVVVARGSDPFSAREMREFVESRAWATFVARVDRMIETERDACEKTNDPDAWRRAQGAIGALRRVKQIPQIVGDELKQSSD